MTKVMSKSYDNKWISISEQQMTNNKQQMNFYKIMTVYLKMNPIKKNIENLWVLEPSSNEQLVFGSSVKNSSDTHRTSE